MGGIHAYNLFPQLWARPRKLPGNTLRRHPKMRQGIEQ